MKKSPAVLSLCSWHTGCLYNSHKPPILPFVCLYVFVFIFVFVCLCFYVFVLVFVCLFVLRMKRFCDTLNLSWSKFGCWSNGISIVKSKRGVSSSSCVCIFMFLCIWLYNSHKPPIRAFVFVFRLLCGSPDHGEGPDLHFQGTGPNEQEKWDGWRPCRTDAISEVGR